jgi:hypothetical protein
VRTRGKLAGAALTLAVLGLAPGAIADSPVVRDRAGDTNPEDAPEYDIRRASASHARGGRLRHAIQTERRAARSSVMVFVDVGRRSYIVDFVGVWNARTIEKTGRVKVRRRGRRIIFTFSRRAIRSPRSYRWKAASIIGGHFDGATPDTAPNGQRYRRHRLRR